jgi:hypothetical protein
MSRRPFWMQAAVFSRRRLVWAFAACKAVSNVIVDCFWRISVPAFRPRTDHEWCNRVPNWISLKTGLEEEIEVTELRELPDFGELKGR